MARIVHFDIRAEKPKRTIDFYTKVFGWKFYKWDGPMEYWLIGTGPKKEPGINGGMSKGKPYKGQVLTIGVKNLNAALKKLVRFSGKVTMPRSPIPGVGWFAAFKDPAGNELGLEQYDPKAK